MERETERERVRNTSNQREHTGQRYTDTHTHTHTHTHRHTHKSFFPNFFHIKKLTKKQKLIVTKCVFFKPLKKEKRNSFDTPTQTHKHTKAI